MPLNRFFLEENNAPSNIAQNTHGLRFESFKLQFHHDETEVVRISSRYRTWRILLGCVLLKQIVGTIC